MTPDIQSTITRLKELELEASPAPWGIESYVDEPFDTVSGGYISSLTTPDGVIEQMGCTCCDYGLKSPTTHDFDLIVELRNVAPALIADYERKTRKLAIYEKRLGYIAKNYPLVHADALEYAPEKEN